MAEYKNKGGRPHLTEEQKTQRKAYLVHKLEPYLMSGLSVNKALRESKVFNSEFYKYLAEDRFFGEKIAKARQFISVLANQAIFTELVRIIEKQNGNPAKKIEPQPLSNDEVDYLCWYALHANVCQEEWGRRVRFDSFDPDAEIQRLKIMLEKQNNASNSSQ